MATPRRRITFKTPVRRKAPTTTKKPLKEPISEPAKDIKKEEIKKKNNNSKKDTKKEEIKKETNKSTKKDTKKEETKKEETKNLKNPELNNTDLNKTDLLNNTGLLNNTDLQNYLKSIEKTRKSERDLILNYAKENECLRNLTKSVDTLLCNKFLGLDIQETDTNIFQFCWVNNDRKLVFTLQDLDEDFGYEYIESENVGLPDALNGSISFEKGQVMKFFYHVMEVLLGKM